MGKNRILDSLDDILDSLDNIDFSFNLVLEIGGVLGFVFFTIFSVLAIPTDFSKMSYYKGLFVKFDKTYVRESDLWQRKIYLTSSQNYSEDNNHLKDGREFVYAEQDCCKNCGFDTLNYDKQLFEIWYCGNWAKEIHVDGIPVVVYKYRDELKTHIPRLFAVFLIAFFIIAFVKMFVVPESKINRARKKQILYYENDFYECLKEFIVDYKLSKYYLLDIGERMLLRKRISDNADYPQYEIFSYSKEEISASNVKEAIDYIDFFHNPICKKDEKAENYFKLHKMSEADFEDLIERCSDKIPVVIKEGIAQRRKTDGLNNADENSVEENKNA